MSTAGKVLSVFVMLLAIVWVILTAGVAQLNHNWAQRLDEDTKAIEKLESDVLATQGEVVTTKDQASHEQLVAENELAVRESEIIEKEKGRAQTIESATRVKLQAEGMEGTLKAAKADQEQRQADLTAETDAKTALEKSVTTMSNENKALLAEVAALREKFKTALHANREKAGLPALNLNP
jgi:hypothetical protein